MKHFYLDKRAEGLADGAPRGVISRADQWVRSTPITVPWCAPPFVIHGRADAFVACDDGTTGVIDFKTNEPKQAHVSTYGRQLHAYALALEHAASGPPTEVGSRVSVFLAG
jgi:ATP-dependent exoDNAse (exonuclease V) beta subunit